MAVTREAIEALKKSYVGNRAQMRQALAQLQDQARQTADTINALNGAIEACDKMLAEDAKAPEPAVGRPTKRKTASGK